MSSERDTVACGLVVKVHEHAVLVDDRPVSLTPREFEIVNRLAEHPGWVFSAVDLAEQDSSSEFAPESVSVLVSRVRRKLDRAGIPDAIETVRGCGYRLRLPRTGAVSGVAEGSRTSLRDACWQLQEAAMEVEHAGTEEQRSAAVDILDRARRSVFTVLTR